jgi:hypothetical protein
MEHNPEEFKIKSLEELDNEIRSKEIIKGDGFILDKRQSGYVSHNNFARVEFREGETTASAKIKNNLEREKKEKDWVRNNLKVGNWIQWISQGVNQFEEPKKVSNISEDRKWVFVEGSDVGIPIEQVEFDRYDDKPIGS